MRKVILTNVLDREEKYVLKEGKNVVGRSEKEKNDVNVPLRYCKVSRKHCDITLSDGEVIVKDTNSTRGTYINENGQRIKESPLNDGDKLRLGPNYKLEVTIKDDEEY